MEMKKNEKYCMPHKLAIVIPAYKAKYLSETLDSIASQTDKRLCVYIGDDCSPEDIGSIVSQYEGKFECVYKRFEENLGGRDLVAQWERCIDMTQGEEWIWLFSDDDYMDKNCVAGFYRELSQNRYKVDLYRFDVRILNRNVYAEQSNFPVLTNSVYLYKNKMSGKCPCFAVEYIFSRRIYQQQGGFQNFDLAWNSDVATWIKFGINGIVTIKGPLVIWRASGENITTVTNSDIEYRKWNATVRFLVWIKDYFRQSHQCIDLYADCTFVRIMHGTMKALSYCSCVESASQYLGTGLRRVLLLTTVRLYELLSKLRN